MSVQKVTAVRTVFAGRVAIAVRAGAKLRGAGTIGSTNTVRMSMVMFIVTVA